MAASQALWPWLAVAASGALHGLNPLAGWGIVAWRERKGGTCLLRALVPIAVGNALSVLVVAAAVPLALAFGREFSPLVVQGVAVVLLLAVVAVHVHGRPADHVGLGVWAFIVAMAHGASWMLVPALLPLCASGMPGKEIALSGSVLLVLAAVGLHLAAMLLVTAVASALAARGLRAAIGPDSQEPRPGPGARSMEWMAWSACRRAILSRERTIGVGLK
ncbi:hypothetical protein LZ009_16820 [Ramlibacter sp. XY19]|uniref:hypothetical protein n=1 Tax=Ramlibacter paludis TaxID=2908000 RepID=UPI0023D9B87E|nr:hypothetical protein [Ramlibacter paludis]MCG2594442.1 hypothetical protein [Ramlibacter paludis]